MRVLIVDDDPGVHQTLTGFTASRGHEVLVYPNAEEAWDGFDGMRPALVILDWTQTGADMCRRIREHADGAATVIMAVTDQTDADDLEAVLSYGADDYLTKPIDPKLFGIRLAIAEQRVEEVRKRVEAESEMKRLNEGLKKANKDLQEANEMLGSNQAQLVHSEKMASVGQLAAGIAHEINNPVGFMKSNLGMLSDYVDVFKKLLEDYSRLAEQIRSRPMNGEAEILEKINRTTEEEDLNFLLEDVDSLLVESMMGAERVHEITQSLKSFARLDEAEMQYADINEGLRATLRMIWNELRYHCTLHQDLQPLPPILCYPGQLNQVFMNLLINASHAIEDEGEISIETAVVESEILIRISDTGYGIPESNIPKLFNPFFTTKPVGEGTGLGLSVSYGIIQRHRGRIEVESEVGAGTSFTIYLPIPDDNDE